MISLATTCDTLHDKKKYDFLLDEKKKNLFKPTHYLEWYNSSGGVKVGEC